MKLATVDNLYPDRVWAALMSNEKPGGRSVAAGTIDMTVWDGVRLAIAEEHHSHCDAWQRGIY